MPPTPPEDARSRLPVTLTQNTRKTRRQNWFRNYQRDMDDRNKGGKSAKGKGKGKAKFGKKGKVEELRSPSRSPTPASSPGVREVRLADRR
jgi:hypothetical protein